MNNFVLMLDGTKPEYFESISSINKREIYITNDFNKANVFIDEKCKYFLEVKKILKEIGIDYIKIKNGE